MSVDLEALRTRAQLAREYGLAQITEVISFDREGRVVSTTTPWGHGVVTLHPDEMDAICDALEASR